MPMEISETTPDVRVLSLEGSNPAVLPEFVREARKNVRFISSPYRIIHTGRALIVSLVQRVKALISVGGWTGSRYFSTAVATPQNRTAFVRTVIGFVQKYNLDGVDFE